VAGLLLAAAALAAACSKPPPPPPPAPLIIGPAPAAATGHVRTDQPLDYYTGYAKADQWPSSCDLLTNADIRSVFPQLKGKINHKESSQHFDFDQGGEMDVANADCEITFMLPGVSDPHDASEIDVAIEAVGPPGLVRANGQFDEAVAPRCAFHAELASDQPNEYICGRIEFSVAVRLELPTADSHRPDRFQVDGKVTGFPQFTADQAEPDFEDAHITSALVAAVIQKLPPSR
jgi:hypothetical protein